MNILWSLIKRFEGLRLKPYLCPAGVATIGYGSTGPDITLSHPPVTETWAEERMRRDAALYYDAIGRLSPTAVGEAREALGDFAYNMGTTRYKSSTLRRRIDAGDYEGAREEIMKWVFGGGRRLPGLILRRAAEAPYIRSAAPSN